MRIGLVEIGCKVPELLVLKKIFNSEISVYMHSLNSNYFNPSRGQYDAEKILMDIRKADYPCDKVLGVVAEDIYVSGLNFVFGLADINGKSSLISIYRLRGERFRERALKEAMHELGHTFGLTHCKNPCVMRFSNSLFDVDKKSINFCSECKDYLKHLKIILA